MSDMTAAPAVEHVHRGIDEASRSIEEELTLHLRQHARSMGWPADVAQHLRVAYRDGAYHPSYGDDAREAVEGLEYGSLDVRPRAALRTWALTSHEHASDLHDRALSDVIARELF